MRPRQQLGEDDLVALAALEARVREADGVALKLEWAVIRERRILAALTEHVDGELVGFLGVYAQAVPDAELTGMVDPRHRRAGIASRLLDRAMEICAQEGLDHRLLIIPRAAEAAIALARSRGGEVEHSEYSMVLEGEPRRVTEDLAVTLRPVREADRANRARILEAGFGGAPESLLGVRQPPGVEQLVIEHDGRLVGVIRLTLRDGGTGSDGFIHGFAIDPEYRGRGIGRDVLGRSCARLSAGGAQRVRLEVAVENDAALGLYTSTGFVQVSTEDYYLLP